MFPFNNQSASPLIKCWPIVVLVLLCARNAVAQSSCPLNTASPSVTICSPSNLAGTLTSPVHVNAGATDPSHTVKVMQIYVDGVNVYHVFNQPWLDTDVNINAGTHRLTVQAQDDIMQVFKQTIFVTLAGPGDLSSIKHIIFLVQENRSFDNYFGRMGQYRADRGYTDPFDGIPLDFAALDRSGVRVSPFHFQTVCHENLTPAWNQSHYDINYGKMDRFMKAAGSVPSTIDPDGTRAMGYYDWTDLPYYYELAFQFGTSDRFFSPVLAPTNPNRMYLFTGTSFGHIRLDVPAPGTYWTQPTIFDKLDAAGVSWRYYYQDSSVFLSQFSTWQVDSKKVYNISRYYTDLQNSATWPSVIFIERAGQLGLDEHPKANIQKGAANTKKIIDALMGSPAWQSSAFILTYDEGGGLFDHVPPAPVPMPDNIPPMLQRGDIVAQFNETGFRVPLIVISPWSKPHFVSHTPMDLTAILRFIETRFSVSSLTARDAAMPDMTEFFDFSSPHFLTPPPLPDQPTTGTCTYSLEKAPGH